MTIAARSLSTVLALALASACDMNGGPVLERDAGQDGATADAERPDSGADVEAPRVIETLPAHGTEGVAPDTVVMVRFSEPMRAGAGTITLQADGAPATAQPPSWNEEGTELSFQPDEPFATNVRVRVGVSGFEDLAGNALAAPYAFTFDVGDTVAPTIVATTPEEGATEVSGRLTEIELVFSEPMSSTGTVTLEGGPGEVGPARWSATGVRFPVSGLAYGTRYRAVPVGFEDLAGNALDTSVYLETGALSFTTGADLDGPRVMDSNPDEGQVNVSLRFLGEIQVVFDEPMDTSIRSAELAAPGTVRTLHGTWDASGTTIRFVLAGEVTPNGAHSLDLSGFRDEAGNPLDGVPHLYDGRLDFFSGADDLVPAVVFSTPMEGSADTAFRQTFLRLVFNQAMDTSVTSLLFSDGLATVELSGSWNLAGTRLTFDVSRTLRADTRYTLDATPLRDASGRPLDLSHPYLQDGILDFSTVAPTGENCRDALRASEATETSPGGGLVWVIEDQGVLDADGSASCDSNGVPADAVVHYRKTTPAGGTTGGRWLRVRAHQDPEGSTTLGNRINLEVFRTHCDPLGAASASSRVRCLFDGATWEMTIPAPPDDYFIWVSHERGATFRAIRVTVEEVDAPPQGESCLDPLTTASVSTVYTPPSAESPYHAWDLRAAGLRSYDYGVTNRSPDAMTCAESHGPDGVVRFDKADADSVLDVVLEGWEGQLSGTDLQVVDRCEARAADATERACFAGVRLATPPGVRRLNLRAPSGPLYFWAAAGGTFYETVNARVLVREIPAAPGIDCANAIPLPLGEPVTVAPTDVRLFAPDCPGTAAASANYTWYRVTATERALLLTADTVDGTGGVLAVVDPSTDATLGCTPSIAGSFQSAFLEPGREVCVAVESGRVTQLRAEAVPYEGVGGTVTDLEVLPPLSPTGTQRALGSTNWMTVTPTTLYAGSGTGGSTSFVIHAPKAGGVRAEEYSDYPTSVGGYAAVSVGEAVYSVNASTTFGTSARLHRLVDASGAYSTSVPWDSGTSYPAYGIRTIVYDGTNLWLVSHATTASHQTRVWRGSPSAPGLTQIGDLPGLTHVAGGAIDGTWLYLLGRRGTENGVFRVARAELGSATPTLELIASLSPTPTVGGSFVAIDDVVEARHLYVRHSPASISRNQVHVVVSPGGASPRHLGAMLDLAGTSVRPIAFDVPAQALYVIDSAAASFLRVE